jgi:hypothetical protein
MFCIEREILYETLSDESIGSSQNTIDDLSLDLIIAIYSIILRLHRAALEIVRNAFNELFLVKWLSKWPLIVFKQREVFKL